MTHWAEEATRPHLAHSKQKVMADTFGHLAPEKKVIYKGKILFCLSAFNNGNIELIDFKFDNDLESSPWLFDAINDFLFDNFKDESEGTVYEIEIQFKNYKIKKLKPLKTIISL